MRVGIRVDAGPVIGGGHAMRCLTLANALAERGAEIMFVAASMPDTLEARIRASGHRIEKIPLSRSMTRTGSNWHEPPLDGEVQAQDCSNTAAALGAVDWLVVDHYLLDKRWHSAARSFAEKLLVIDDLANRPYDCDLLLDQTLGRAAADYQDLVPNGATILAGPIFALLRPEFEHERGASLRRRRDAGPVKRILISLGMIDPAGVTGKIAKTLSELAPECALDIVLSQEAPSFAEVEALARERSGVRIHSATERMAELMRDADLAIGAAGTTSWERCCLGLPSVLLTLADNQMETANRLQACGAATVVTDVNLLSSAAAHLRDDPKGRQAMTAAAAAIVDGHGAHRVAGAVTGEMLNDPVQLELRAARPSESELLWLWRNDPLAREMAKNRDPIAWSDHEQWFARVAPGGATTLAIAELAGRPAAMVRFDRSGGEALVSINVSPAMRGRGFGTVALQLACDAYQADHPGVSLIAEIRRANGASRSAFNSAGFTERRSDTPGLERYLRPGCAPAEDHQASTASTK